MLIQRTENTRGHTQNGQKEERFRFSQIFVRRTWREDDQGTFGDKCIDEVMENLLSDISTDERVNLDIKLLIFDGRQGP